MPMFEGTILGEWTDAKKWKMDLVKSALAFSVAAVLTLFVVNKIQEVQALENAKASAFYTERVSAMRQLQSETVIYDRAAHTAYTELYQWSSRQKTPAMVEYEQVAYPRWQLVLESAEYLFPDCQNAIKSLRTLNEQRHEIYHRFVYTQVDYKGEITTAWMNDRRNELWNERAGFEDLETKMSEARIGIIRGMQQALFPIPTSGSSVSGCSSTLRPLNPSK